MTATDSEIKRKAEILRLSDGDLQKEEAVNHGTLSRTTTGMETHWNDDSRARTSKVFLKEKSPSSSAARATTGPYPYRFIPLKMSGRTHVPSEESRSLIENEVSFEDLQRMTELFYEKAFQDKTLDQFIRSHDDPHGARFAKWIHQKLTGSKIWDQDRAMRSQKPVQVAGGRLAVVHDRSSAHAAAWYSPKRPSRDVGRHFELDECRVWMRLHFWAMRESGIMELSPSFADYYVRFIGRFVAVYEGSATVFARDSLRWSASEKNIQQYLRNGRKMKDVLGMSYSKAIGQIPESEAEDDEWPYNQAPRSE